jgi:hypothetical protein
MIGSWLLSSISRPQPSIMKARQPNVAMCSAAFNPVLNARVRLLSLSTALPLPLLLLLLLVLPLRGEAGRALLPAFTRRLRRDVALLLLLFLSFLSLLRSQLFSMKASCTDSAGAASASMTMLDKSEMKPASVLSAGTCHCSESKHTVIRDEYCA